MTCSGAPCMSLGHLFEARATPSWMSKISFPGTAGIEVHCFLQTKYVANSLQTWLVDLFVDIFLINFIGQDDQLLLGSKIDQHDLTWFATLQLSLAKEGSKKSQYGKKNRKGSVAILAEVCLSVSFPTSISDLSRFVWVQDISLKPESKASIKSSGCVATFVFPIPTTPNPNQAATSSRSNTAPTGFPGLITVMALEISVESGGCSCWIWFCFWKGFVSSNDHQKKRSTGTRHLSLRLRFESLQIPK